MSHENTDSRAQLGRHALWEVPVYAWVMKNKGKTEWMPSLDFNLWNSYGCQGTHVNEDAVNVLIDNLKGHYRGNRAPFHIGLHAQNYTKNKTCERAAIAKAFDEIDRLIEEGFNLRYAAMPELLVWMGRPKR